MPATIIRIGDKLDPERSLWAEGPHYNYPGQHVLHLFYARPNRAEVLSVQTLPCRFALYVDAPILLLLYQFGTMPWGDAPFHWSRMSEPPELPSVEQGQHAVLNTLLIDTTQGGQICALRMCTLSPTFTLNLHHAMRAQALAGPPNPDLAIRQLQRVYSRYTTERLAERCTVRCAGGS